MSRFTQSWLAAAAEAFEAELSRPVDLLPGAAIPETAARFALMVDIAGEWGGTFTVTVDESALTALLGVRDKAQRLGEGTPEGPPAGLDGGELADVEAIRELWQRIFQRVCVAAAADLGTRSGLGCEVAMISPEDPAVDSQGMGYQLRAGESSESIVALTIADHVIAAPVEPPVATDAARSANAASLASDAASSSANTGAPSEAAAAFESKQASLARGIDLLLGVELEASLRFGSREMMLSDLLALGPGDVIQLDRALADPVDLIIGDKIVARGEVVLVNGNFGLEVTEVAEPRKSLESIRCLF